MTPTLALNITVAPLLVIALMFADYMRKYNTDSFQRRIFCAVLILTFLAILSDLGYLMFSGEAGGAVHSALWIINFCYYLFQVAAYYFLYAFVDYITFKDTRRAKVALKIVAVFQLIHIVLLLFNLRFGFYYFIDEDNIFVHGSHYYIRLIISYFPVVLAGIDVLSCFKHKMIRQAEIRIVLLFILFCGFGSTVDLFLGTGNLIWPCLVSSLLYAYFFIIRSDSRIDPLTGIGNRESFNEFIEKLLRTNSKQSYSIVMIDVDEFKHINDTYGHHEGDRALVDLATILKNSVRHSDFVARYGGDEFIFATQSVYDIDVVIDRLQKAITAHNEKGIRPYTIKISCGRDIFTTKSGQSIEDFMIHIDHLMYQHKRERRGKEELRVQG